MMTRQVSVITGGSGDVGLATAKIVGRDHLVLLSGVRQARLDRAVAELRQSGIECRATFCDVTDRTSVSRLVDAATQLGPVASVIHAAGVSPSMHDPEKILRVNAVGTTNVNESFYPVIGAGSAIVNVASMAAHMFPGLWFPARHFGNALDNPESFLRRMRSTYRIAPRRYRAGVAYMLSKSFSVWYCTSQAARFGARGARILSVSPGSIDSEMGRLEVQTGSADMLRYSALARFAKPDEIAEVLAFCAGPKASYLTGIDILCDGGVIAGMPLRDKLIHRD